MTSFQRGIKQIIEGNCKKGVYAERFNKELQKEIKQKSEVLATMTLEDEALFEALELAIEDSIRIMVQSQ